MIVPDADHVNTSIWPSNWMIKQCYEIIFSIYTQFMTHLVCPSRNICVRSLIFSPNQWPDQISSRTNSMRWQCHHLDPNCTVSSPLCNSRCHGYLCYRNCKIRDIQYFELKFCLPIFAWYGTSRHAGSKFTAYVFVAFKSLNCNNFFTNVVLPLPAMPSTTRHTGCSLISNSAAEWAALFAGDCCDEHPASDDMFICN